MADETTYTPLPADLPEDWTIDQTIAPTGADVGLSQQHGYNYLMQQVNNTQRAVNGQQEQLGEKQDTITGVEGQVVGFDSDGHAIPQTGVGRSMAGQTVEPTQGTSVEAGDGAEVFNTYAQRTYNASRTPTAGNVASGIFSHAEGSITTASGDSAHAEGYLTTASGLHSHAEGRSTTAANNQTHTEGYKTFALGLQAHAEGSCSIAAGSGYAHAEGGACIAAYSTQTLKVLSYDAAANTFTFDTGFVGFSDAFSHLSVGSILIIVNAYYVGATSLFTVSSVDSANNNVTVSETIPTSNFTPTYAVNTSYAATTGYAAHAEGDRTVAIGGYGAHAEGRETTASGSSGAHAEGYLTTASGGSGAHAEGCLTTASGLYSHAGGYGTIAHFGEFVIGFSNVDSGTSNTGGAPRTQTTFIVGNGFTDETRSNAFRVSGQGAYGIGAWNSSGADYAELLEWADGNPDKEDRAGLFVTLEGDKIRLARAEDNYILGIVSASPSVVGDVYDDQWAGMYLRDVFGRTVMEMQDFPAVLGPDGEEIIPAHRELAPKVNPDYDSTVKYQPRTQRPEWDAVGMMGKLVAVDDGTCVVNGYAAVGEGGKATASPVRSKYRVMARLDESHVRIMIL